MDLTMAEKRDLIERITELVKNDILNKEDRETSSGYALRHAAGSLQN